MFYHSFNVLRTIKFMWVYVITMTLLFSISSVALLSRSIAYAMSDYNSSYQSIQHSGEIPPPTSASSLVVLLDRSGSVGGSQGTDPNGYSTSVAKVLADLWPGLMAVIPFSGDGTNLPVFGPFPLSNLARRAALENYIQNYPIGGNTPLAPAMHLALRLLKNAAPGSRIVLITDGAPTGINSNSAANQEQDIQNNIVHQLQHQGIPVNVFGLEVVGADANNLLTDIGSGEGSYMDVQKPEELARAVIGFYSQWSKLNFTPLTQNQNGNFSVPVDPFAQKVYVIVFRSSSKYTISFTDPDNQPIKTSQVTQASDQHYGIYSIIVSSPAIPGIYHVNVAGDPDAQVYYLVQSTLNVKILAPEPKSTNYTPISIKAAFYDGPNLLTPQNHQAQMLAVVTLLVEGKPYGSTNEQILTQQGPYFLGKTPGYPKAGDVQIEIMASYQGYGREASVSLHFQPLPSQTNTSGARTCIFCGWVPWAGVFIPLGFLVFLLVLFYVRIRRRSNRRPRNQPSSRVP